MISLYFKMSCMDIVVPEGFFQPIHLCDNSELRDGTPWRVPPNTWLFGRRFQAPKRWNIVKPFFPSFSILPAMKKCEKVKSVENLTWWWSGILWKTWISQQLNCRFASWQFHWQVYWQYFMASNISNCKLSCARQTSSSIHHQTCPLVLPEGPLVSNHMFWK